MLLLLYVIFAVSWASAHAHILYPVASSTLYANQRSTIRWEAKRFNSPVQLYLVAGEVCKVTRTSLQISASAMNSGSYLYMPDARTPASDGYSVLIKDSSGVEICSDQFSIFGSASESETRSHYEINTYTRNRLSESQKTHTQSSISTAITHLNSSTVNEQTTRYMQTTTSLATTATPFLPTIPLMTTPTAIDMTPIPAVLSKTESESVQTAQMTTTLEILSTPTNVTPTTSPYLPPTAASSTATYYTPPPYVASSVPLPITPTASPTLITATSILGASVSIASPSPAKFTGAASMLGTTDMSLYGIPSVLGIFALFL